MLPVETPITGTESASRGSPLEALVDFYSAFNSRDMVKMADNWDQSEDIAMDNPLGGIKRGWSEIKSVYNNIFNGEAKVYVEFYDYTIHEHGDVFFAVGRERGQFSKGEQKVNLAIRTSRIFARTPVGWRQVHHHGSITDPSLLGAYQNAVMK